MVGKNPSKKKKSRQGTVKEVSELKSQLARALADYDNFRKRVEREREKASLIANLKLIQRILPVYDMLEEAQTHLEDSGISLTIKEFEQILKEEGVEKMDTKPGVFFNENEHEVIEISQKGAKKEGQIVKTTLSGWKFKEGVIIRPAKVVVYKVN